eukprot:1158265-Pelagomonas_calceolata.AAC.5
MDDLGAACRLIRRSIEAHSICEGALERSNRYHGHHHVYTDRLNCQKWSTLEMERSPISSTGSNEFRQKLSALFADGHWNCGIRGQGSPAVMKSWLMGPQSQLLMSLC